MNSSEPRESEREERGAEGHATGASLLQNFAYTAVAGLGIGGTFTVIGYTIRHAQAELLGGATIGGNLEDADLSSATAEFLADLPSSLEAANPLWLVASIAILCFAVVASRLGGARKAVRRFMIGGLLLELLVLFVHFARPVVGLRNVLIRTAPDFSGSARELDLWAFLACPVWQGAENLQGQQANTRQQSNCAVRLGCSEPGRAGYTLIDFYANYVGGTLLGTALYAALLGTVLAHGEWARRSLALSLLGVPVLLSLWCLSYAYGKAKASVRPPRVEAMISADAFRLGRPDSAMARAQDGVRGKMIGWIVGQHGDRSVVYSEDWGQILELSGEDLGPVKFLESWVTVRDAHIRNRFFCTAAELP